MFCVTARIVGESNDLVGYLGTTWLRMRDGDYASVSEVSMEKFELVKECGVHLFQRLTTS